MMIEDENDTFQTCFRRIIKFELLNGKILQDKCLADTLQFQGTHTRQGQYSLSTQHKLLPS